MLSVCAFCCVSMSYVVCVCLVLFCMPYVVVFVLGFGVYVCLYAIFFVNWCACMSCDLIKCLVLRLHAPCCVCMTCDLFVCPVLCQYAMFFV